jgi:hypothetical protein
MPSARAPSVTTTSTVRTRLEGSDHRSEQTARALSPAHSRDDLIRRLESVLAVPRGRREGERETRVELDHRLPSPVAAGEPAARWRLASTASRLYPPPTESEPLKAWRTAEGQKGRRLVASDLRYDNRVAAILAWHFEPKPRSGARRPHLITAAAVRKDLEDTELRAEYLVALWLLVCVVAAIDRKTGQVGRIGLVLDGGIALTASELAAFGFQRGRMSDGYRGDYYTFSA